MGNSGGPESLHPRVAVSGLCFPALSAGESVEVLGDLGVTKTSMTSAKLRECGTGAVVDACRRRGVEVVTTTALVRFDLTRDPSRDHGARVAEQTRRAREDIDQAAAVGASSVYTLTGPRAYPDWADNVEAYAGLVSDLVEYGAERNIALAVEPTSWLYADLSFVHSFHDSVAFASRTGMRVCLDLFHAWTEGTLRRDIERHIDLICHVQLSDMQRGARSLPCRAVPGDGDVPLRAIVRWLLDAGYPGVFDLELSGPGIDELGHREAAGYSAAWLDALLAEVDA
jgi:sugar phosphate isomerase/epimerase